MTKSHFSLEDQKTIGEHIRYYRKLRGLTMKAVAIALGKKDPATVYRCEKGFDTGTKCALRCDEKKIAAFANVLQIPYEWLMPAEPLHSLDECLEQNRYYNSDAKSSSISIPSDHNGIDDLIQQLQKLSYHQRVILDYALLVVETEKKK